MGNRNTHRSDDVNDVIVNQIVWFENEIKKNIEQQLRTIVNHVKIFDDEKQCGKYILSLPAKQWVILIVNDQQGEDIVPFIHSLRQVKMIYVYRKDQKGFDQWTKRFSKIKAVVKTLDELIIRIKTDQEQVLSIGVINNKIEHLISPFAYSQLVSNVLLQSKSRDTDRIHLISLLRDMYKQSDTELQIIEEFQQTYSSHRALWWYTRLNWLEKIFNQALRTQDIDRIFLFQFFVQDIHEKIIDNQCQSFVRVYRSQLMIDDEINSLKKAVGWFFSIPTFFSTVIDRNQAFDLLKTSTNSNGFHRVFFEINADPDVVTTKPFADITRYSHFPQEREILFSIGSIFRITNVHLDDNQIWIIEMMLCCDDESNLEPLFQQMENQYGAMNGDMAFLSFSRWLREMKKYDEAEKYCQRLFKQFASNDLLLGILYDELAVIAACKNDLKLRDEWLRGAKEIKEKNESSNNDDSFEILPMVADSDSINNFRFTDIAAEKHDILLPIEGHEKMPLVSLEEAIQPLISILPDIRRKAHTAKLKCKHPADGLTCDQSAAIMLYTMEWEPQNECLYFILNSSLRMADRGKLKPWFLYLKLILTGLSRLPSIQRTIYRGVKLDLSSEHKEGDQFFWWGFSSCTTSLNVLKSDQYLGENSTRTLFNIECLNGKDIRRHSYYEKEDEILLLPATFFKVITCFQMASDLHMIQLQEIKPEFPYLEPIVY